MTGQQSYPISVMLSCRDTKKSVAYYRDVLGFTVKESWPDADQPMWANMVLDKQSVMLGAAPSDAEAEGCGHGPPDKLAWWLERTREQTAIMSECQSCGMPLADAAPGEMYCQYCTDDDGHLRPFEDVLEGTIQGYFMGMKKMERPAAESAAKQHLSKMPAWSARG